MHTSCLTVLASKLQQHTLLPDGLFEGSIVQMPAFLLHQQQGCRQCVAITSCIPVKFCKFETSLLPIDDWASDLCRRAICCIQQAWRIRYHLRQQASICIQRMARGWMARQRFCIQYLGMVHIQVSQIIQQTSC